MVDMDPEISYPLMRIVLDAFTDIFLGDVAGGKTFSQTGGAVSATKDKTVP